MLAAILVILLNHIFWSMFHFFSKSSLEYDIFQIVFSDAWWIGKKDENPGEARLDFPKELFEVVSFYNSFLCLNAYLL